VVPERVGIVIGARPVDGGVFGDDLVFFFFFLATATVDTWEYRAQAIAVLRAARRVE